MADSSLLLDERGHTAELIERSADGERLRVRRADGREAWIDATLLTGDRLAISLDRIDENEVLFLSEERLVLDKLVEETGVVRLHKRVVEREETVRFETAQESVSVETVPVGRVVEGPVPIRHEGDTMIVPILEEVVVVEKRLMLREEVRITRTRTTVPQERTVVLRTEEAVVEREGSDSTRS